MSDITGSERIFGADLVFLAICTPRFRPERYEDIDAYWKTVNIYKFSKEFCRDKYVPFLDAYCKVMGNNEYYEEVLKVLTFLNRTELKALPIAGEKWYEIDDEDDLEYAEKIIVSAL